METTRFPFSIAFKSMLIGFGALISVVPVASAQQAPYGKSTPMSSRDRVYTADQISNTVSVIDPSTNQALGVIRLGDPITGVLSPVYKGQLLVHGLGFSPDDRALAVISIGSNSVTLIDTVTNKSKEQSTLAGLLTKDFSRLMGRSFGSWCGVRTIFPSSILWV